MVNIQITDYTTILAFWLIFTRMVAIMFQLPIFDNNSIPSMVKILSTVLITYAFFPYLEPHMIKDIQYLGSDHFWVLTIFNVLIGLIIGFFVKILMSIFVASGSIITQEMGFGAIRYFDPNASQQVGPFEKLLQWTILIVIISSGALLPMFKGVINSFDAIHVYQLGKMTHMTLFFVNLFKSIFMTSILLASPLIFTNVLIMAVLGIIARTVPQMNVLMVSFVVNIGMGLLVFAATSDEFFRMAYKIYTEKLADWFHFIS